MASPAEVRAYIEQQAKAAGLSQNDIRNLLTTAQKESSMGQSLKNPKSSAKGVFQFIDSTGAQYGLNSPDGKGFDNRLDMKANVDAGIKFYKANQKALAPTLRKLGIPVDDPAAMYLAHNQGAGGARSLYRSLGSGKTVNQILKSDEKAKKNAMDGLTADQAIAMWGGKADRFAKKLGLAPGGAWKPTDTVVSSPPKLPPTPQATAPVIPPYLSGTSAPTTPPPYAPMQAFQTPTPPQVIPQAPLQPQPTGLSSTLASTMMPIPPIEPEPVTLESIIKRAADISGNKNRAGFGVPSIDPMTYDIMRLIENS
jgi:hypothetical protein